MIDEKLKKELIEKGRRFMHGYHDDDLTADSDFNPSDQQLRLPQPPLCKAPMAEDSAKISLSLDFSGLSLNNDVISLIRDRRSARVYTEEKMSLSELSFLLWATPKHIQPPSHVKQPRREQFSTLVHHCNGFILGNLTSNIPE